VRNVNEALVVVEDKQGGKSKKEKLMDSEIRKYWKQLQVYQKLRES